MDTPATSPPHRPAMARRLGLGLGAALAALGLAMTTEGFQRSAHPGLYAESFWGHLETWGEWQTGPAEATGYVLAVVGLAVLVASLPRASR